MDLATAFNAVEAGIWAGFVLLTALFGGRVPGMTPRSRGVLAVAFLGFGISDLIEMSTGAWWRPPGLLVLKGICLTTIVLIAWRVRPRRRGSVEERSPVAGNVASEGPTVRSSDD